MENIEKQFLDLISEVKATIFIYPLSYFEKVMRWMLENKKELEKHIDPNCKSVNFNGMEIFGSMDTIENVLNKTEKDKSK